MPISRKSSRGFSLVEITAALAILALVGASLGSLLQGTLGVTASLREQQGRQQEIDGLFSLCRSSFRSLPADASMELRFREHNGQNLPELVFRTAPDFFAFDKIHGLDPVVILGTKPEIGGHYSLALLRIDTVHDAAADPSAHAAASDWLVLVSGITHISWRFFDAQSKQWTVSWVRSTRRPSAVELTLSLEDSPRPLRAVFPMVSLQTDASSQSNLPPPTP